MISDYLGEIPAGQVRTAFCDSISSQLNALRSWLNCGAPDLRLAVLTLRSGSSVTDSPTQLIDELLAALAESAAAVWPAWYGRNTFDCAYAGTLDEHVQDLLAVVEVNEQLRAVSRDWLAAAVACLRDCQPPLPNGFPAARQARQLALAMEPTSFVFIYAMCDLVGQRDGVRSSDDGDDVKLAVMVRALEWLAEKTAARVLLLAPIEMREAPELERVSFAAWMDESSAGEKHRSAELAGEHLAGGGSAQPAAREARREPRLSCWPIAGRPSPFSAGEQLLAKRLARDAILGPLFGFNEWVDTRFGSRFLVDLLWRAGRCVVEVDGYSYHSSPAAFSSDRHRDYELAASGYVVLRIPHDEVLDDIERAIAKIRHIVDTRQPTFPAMESDE